MNVPQAVTAFFFVGYVASRENILQWCANHPASEFAKAVNKGLSQQVTFLLIIGTIVTFGLMWAAFAIYFIAAGQQSLSPIARLIGEINNPSRQSALEGEAADSAIAASTSSSQLIDELADKFFVKRRGDHPQRKGEIYEALVEIAMGRHGPLAEEVERDAIPGSAYECHAGRAYGALGYDANGMGLQYFSVPLNNGVGQPRCHALSDLFGLFLNSHYGIGFRDPNETLTKDDEALLCYLFELVSEEARVRVGIRTAALALGEMDSALDSAQASGKGSDPLARSFLEEVVGEIGKTLFPVVLSTSSLQGRAATVFGSERDKQFAAVIAALEMAFSSKNKLSLGKLDPFAAIFMAAAVGSGGGDTECKDLIVRLARDGLSKIGAEAFSKHVYGDGGGGFELQDYVDGQSLSSTAKGVLCIDLIADVVAALADALGTLALSDRTPGGLCEKAEFVRGLCKDGHWGEFNGSRWGSDVGVGPQVRFTGGLAMASTAFAKLDKLVKRRSGSSGQSQMA
ncbi:MAG: hypothetical protein LBI39_04435 [Puniceicoccales bacterium]|nr:hypothetical protein [Puniceicoccales bacterium]